MLKKQFAKVHVSRALLAALIGVIALPTAMTGLFRSIDNDGIHVAPMAIDLHEKALEDTVRLRRVRRSYWKAVDRYNELSDMGVENLTPPSINDLDSIRFYLEPDSEITHAAASAEVNEAEMEYNNLPERYRDLLDGYVGINRCPGSLRQYHLAGFYELCNRLLDERVAAKQTNLLDRSAHLRRLTTDGFAPQGTLRDRLEILEDSLYPRTHTIENFRPSLRD